MLYFARKESVKMQNTEDLKSTFLVDPEVTFLNFGSYGACPKPIFEDYMKWQWELEREPVQFIAVNGPRYLKSSREALGAFINCPANDLVFTPNPTHAVNIVAKSFNLKEGDEILSTNIEYGACDKTWSYYCQKAGAKFIQQPITLPLVSKQQFIDEFFQGLNNRIKLIFISQITSATGLLLPVEEICEIAKQKGLLTFVDGAHAPGQIPIDLQTLKADFYMGACHKWMMTPKGCSFLYVKHELQPLFDPLIISWGYQSAAPSESQFLDYHQFNGTRDFSAYLTIPAAIAFMKEHNWETVAADCRKLVRENAQRFCDLLHTKPLCPLTEEFLVQLFSIPINTSQPEKLYRHLFDKYKIEIPVMKQGDKIYIRYSIQAFNSQQDLDKLYDALKEIKETTDLILI